MSCGAIRAPGDERPTVLASALQTGLFVAPYTVNVRLRRAAH